VTLLDPRPDSDPYAIFDSWYSATERAAPPHPDAMMIATASPDGRPSLRTVLLKGVVDGRFRFFTHYASRKGRELADNPNVALLFYWPWITRQVRIEGVASKLSSDESDRYFASRPRESQISAFASPQSRPIDRDMLEAERDRVEARYLGKPVPRPSEWGGFGVEPGVFEFWVGQQARFHERYVYRRSGSGWLYETLAP